MRAVPCESLNTPWVVRGRCVYPSSQLADYGDLIATFEDVDGVVGVEAVCAVNAFMEAKEHIDHFFKDSEASETSETSEAGEGRTEAEHGPQG